MIIIIIIIIIIWLQHTNHLIFVDWNRAEKNLILVQYAVTYCVNGFMESTLRNLISYVLKGYTI